MIIICMIVFGLLTAIIIGGIMGMLFDPDGTTRYGGIAFWLFFVLSFIWFEFRFYHELVAGGYLT